jgi:Flp pilus assembly pilin Flp
MTAFWRSQRGAAVLEFALVLPLVLIMILGTIDVGLETMLDGALDRGASAASRVGVTVAVPPGTNRDDLIYATVWDQVGQFVQNKSQLTVSTMTYPTFSNIGQPEPCNDDSYKNTGTCTGSYSDINANGHWDADMGASGAGGYGAIVRYQIKISGTTFTGILKLLGISMYNFQRTIVVQNES